MNKKYLWLIPVVVVVSLIALVRDAEAPKSETMIEPISQWYDACPGTPTPLPTLTPLSMPTCIIWPTQTPYTTQTPYPTQPPFTTQVPSTPLPVAGDGVLIGWYTNDVSIQSINNLSVYSAQGATQMLAYNCWHAGVGATRAYLDAAQNYGIKVWVDMRLHVVGTPSKADWQAFINNIRDHPALAGYYIADEPEWSGPEPSVVRQYYEWTKEADSEHSAAIAHSWTIKSSWAGTYDTVFMDVYPGWSGAGGCSDLPYEFNVSVRRSYQYWFDGKRAADSYGVPIHAIALGFGYSPGTISCQGGVRDLTDAEHRWHTLLPVVLGYEGVFFWWDMEDASMVQTNVHMKALVATRFGEISGIATEMANGITNDPRISISVPQDQIIYRYGESNDQRILLMVNVVRDTSAGMVFPDVQITLPMDVDQVEVLGEGRSIPVINGTFVDSFDRFGVHIYKF